MRIRNANVFLDDGQFHTCDVSCTDVVTEIGSCPRYGSVDAAGLYLVPGFFDVHTHGTGGCDFSDGIAEDIPMMARRYAQNGVTSFLATTMTLLEDALSTAVGAVARFTPARDEAACAGVFMEGPFLSYAKRGAQAAENLHAPDEGFFARINAASGGRVRMVAVAPEEPNAIPFIRYASPKCVVSLAHTVAGYEEALAGFEAGATQLTHTYNGMNGLQHREPGPIGAGMDKNAYAELICDGLHVHPSAVRALFRMFPGHVVLISDSVRSAGMPDGEYTLGGQPIELRDGRCTLKGTDTIAGSVINVHAAVKNAVRFGVSPETAIASATHNPARALRMENERGFIRPGLPADMVLLDRNLDIVNVILRGRPLFADR